VAKNISPSDEDLMKFAFGFAGYIFRQLFSECGVMSLPLNKRRELDH
jgi:hypothetical protein